MSRPPAPAAPLPHAWADDDGGSRRAIRYVVAPGRFLLFAGEDGRPWCEAARQLAAEAGIQIERDGGVLVRPDRFVAWRHRTTTDEPRAALAAVLSRILARPVAGAIVRLAAVASPTGR